MILYAINSRPLVNLAVVTNVVPYILCIIAVPTMMHMSGLEKRRIDRFYFVAVAGVLYCLYAVYACGVDAMLGSAVAVTIGICIYMILQRLGSVSCTTIPTKYRLIEYSLCLIEAVTSVIASFGYMHSKMFYM